MSLNEIGFPKCCKSCIWISTLQVSKLASKQAENFKLPGLLYGVEVENGHTDYRMRGNELFARSYMSPHPAVRVVDFYHAPQSAMSVNPGTLQPPDASDL